VSPASEIATIFWDIGGVLLTNGWDKDQRAEVLGRLGVDLEDYESRHDAANFYWERGLSTAKCFFDQTVFTTSRDFTFEDLWSQVCAESKILHPECFDILRVLAADGRFKTATLNNESRELNEHRLHAFRLQFYFDYFVCSGYVHEMKPDAAIYRSAIEISGYRAEQTLFIDDKQENCEAAMELGMKAIRFESPAQLKGALAQLGIQAA
jgi:FMN phosphatase YigB (HAD superfamily)